MLPSPTKRINAAIKDVTFVEERLMKVQLDLSDGTCQTFEIPLPCLNKSRQQWLGKLRGKRFPVEPVPVFISKVKTAEWEKIGPYSALCFLSRNIADQRPLSKGSVETILFEQSHDNWKVTHQGIALTTEGFLIDGQHRLLAILFSGKCLEILVSRGMQLSSVVYLDRIKTRNVLVNSVMGKCLTNDTLAPMPPRKYIEPAARLIWKVASERKTVPISAISLVVSQYEEEFSALGEFYRMGAPFKYMQNCAVLAAAVLVYRIYPEKTLEAVRALSEGGPSGKCHPIVRLTSFLQDFPPTKTPTDTQKVNELGGQGLRMATFNKAVYALRMYGEGKSSITSLSLQPEHGILKLYPQRKILDD